MVDGHSGGRQLFADPPLRGARTAPTSPPPARGDPWRPDPGITGIVQFKHTGSRGRRPSAGFGVVVSEQQNHRKWREEEEGGAGLPSSSRERKRRH
ncbi:unnamed protein product [Arctogadus glacialis]